MQDTIVDNGSDAVRLSFNIDTANQAKGPNGAITYSVPVDHLLQASGVKTTGLLGVTGVSIHPVSLEGPQGAMYGINLQHGESKTMDVAQKSSFIDGPSGTITTFHHVHTTNAAFGTTKHDIHPHSEIEAALKKDSDLNIKHAVRWRATEAGFTDNRPFELLDDKSILRGVTKSSITNAKGEEETRMLVTQGDTHGPSAVHRAVTHFGSNPEFFGGRYKSPQTVDFNGKKAIVMTEADFRSVEKNLRDGLSAASKNPFNDGFAVRIEKLNDAPNPTSANFSVTLHRTPVVANGSDGSMRTTLNALQAHIGSTEESSAVGTTANIASSIFPGVPQDAVAKFEELALDDPPGDQ